MKRERIEKLKASPKVSACAKQLVARTRELTEYVDDTLVHCCEQDEQVLDEEAEGSHRHLVVDIVGVELWKRDKEIEKVRRSRSTRG